jgi:hypothetical protein
MNCNIQSCYWISNKPRITSDPLPDTIGIQIHQYANNHKYIYIYIFVCIHVCVGMYSLCKYYTQMFGAHPKYAHKTKAL